MRKQTKRAEKRRVLMEANRSSLGGGRKKNLLTDEVSYKRRNEICEMIKATGRGGWCEKRG